MTPDKIEEAVCSCGAGHGSHEGHVDWCAWLKIEPTIRASDEALKEANEVCRSAYQIAARGGADTNWPAFASRLDEALRRQQKALIP